MDKSLMLTMIKDHLGIKTDTEFAEYLGIKPNVLSNWRARNTMDVVVVYAACNFLNPDWLLSSGDDEMLRKDVVVSPVESKEDRDVLLKAKEITIDQLLRSYFRKEKEIADLIDKLDRLDTKFKALLKVIEIDEELMNELVETKPSDY